MNTLYRPELLYVDGTFHRDCGLLIGDDGLVKAAGTGLTAPPDETIELNGKALVPGAVNVHSHSFQRLIRGKSESRQASGKDFWSWRGTMYHAAASLDPQDIYDVARMAFLEMALAGVTTVGEFHYLHNAPDGKPYEDPTLLSRRVIDAAQSVGIRIVLLRTAYFRSGCELPNDPGQIRFFETINSYFSNTQVLLDAYAPHSAMVHIGVAPHSIRAVPIKDFAALVEWARARKLPIHAHLSEQTAENNACLREYGLTPATLLGSERLLGNDFTAVHAIHLTNDEMELFGETGTTICSCPTTERNLGDGIVPADVAIQRGIRFALGSDSQTQIDPWEDARELDYHLRLKHQQRALLDEISGQNLARRLFDSATVNGARSLGVPAGELKPGCYADFFTVNLNEVSLAGHSPASLLPMLVFALSRSAICDVAIGGRMIVREGRHELQDTVVARYRELYRRVWQEEFRA